MEPLGLDLNTLSPHHQPITGAKAAHLARIVQETDIPVPPAFCLTTATYRAALGGTPRTLPRAAWGSLQSWMAHHPGPYAVRSSANHEDGPHTAAAGVYHTTLHVSEEAAVRAAIVACWESLQAPAATTHRTHTHPASPNVEMAVLVQQMVPAQVAGTLFTADPHTGNRRTSVIEAVSGLSDALLAGRASPARFSVREETITRHESSALLTDEHITHLVHLGRALEQLFGAPQDIEWCFHDGQFFVVQSRPISTLFPLPAAIGEGFRVYVSVGHAQMMTDPLSPLGLSVFQRLAARPMLAAGGRLFVDPTAQLQAPTSRAALLGLFEATDPLTHNALCDALPRVPLAEAAPSPPAGPWGAPPSPADPSLIPVLLREHTASLEELRHDLAGLQGPDLLRAIDHALQQTRDGLLDPRAVALLRSGMAAAQWLQQHAPDGVGVPSIADGLVRGAQPSVTAQMSHDLLLLADEVRQYPQVVAYLRHADDAEFWAGLAQVPGGAETESSFSEWLTRYGARCEGEIDIARPRWSETPARWARMLVRFIDQLPPGEAARRQHEGQKASEDAERALFDALSTLPDGAEKANQARAQIRLLHGVAGFRERPKFQMVARLAVLRDALWREADRWVERGILTHRDDIQWLTLDELQVLCQHKRKSAAFFHERRQEQLHWQRLLPPRVLTSDGDTLYGQLANPHAADWVGIGVSPGVVEGTARVCQHWREVAEGAGDILITRFTDPSWTPWFVSVRALVTEVGGMTTHGAVTARELGLPAVVGVQGATTQIQNGQRIRVNGFLGTIERID